MNKRLVALMLLIGFMVSGVDQAFAGVIFKQTGSLWTHGEPEYDPIRNKYWLRFDPVNVDTIYLASYGEDSTYSKVVTDKTFSDTATNRFIGLSDFTCHVYYWSKYYDGAGNLLGELKFYANEIVGGTCQSSSDLVEEDLPFDDSPYDITNPYEGGGSGGNGDGSGGDGDGSGGDGDGSGGDGDGSGGTGDGSGGDGDGSGGNGDGSGGDSDWTPPEWCDPECRIFECPQWDNYMGKLESIKNAIPPAPNWPVVADTFRDSIVPKLIDDLGDLLGEAPAPPVPPPLPELDIDLPEEPEFLDVPGLEESGFTADDIKNQAPVIPEREDPTGGFDLSTNPMDSLPDAPENPIPGETDAGEWGQNKPKEPENPFPYPEDQGDPNVGTPPKPGDNGATPPSPGEDPGNAPTPGGDLGNGPSPGGSGGDSNMLDYKPNPGAADGSGGVIWP